MTAAPMYIMPARTLADPATADEVKQAAKDAKAARDAYQVALAAYHVEADKLAALRERAAKLDTPPRPSLIERAAQAARRFVAGEDDATAPNFERIAIEDARQRAAEAGRAAVADVLREQSERTADAAHEVANAHEVAIHRSIVAEALAVRAEMAAKAGRVSALTMRHRAAVVSCGGIAGAWPDALTDVFPGDDLTATAAIPGVPDAPELGPAMTLAAAETIRTERAERRHAEAIEANRARRAELAERYPSGVIPVGEFQH